MNHELSTMNKLAPDAPNTKTLLVIAGPTASGKTATAIQLAKHFNTEIISADSRQFYREMSIGTAKPDEEELAAVKHHFINSHSITDSFNVGDYERECLLLLDKLFQKPKIVLLVGGSGLFIKAVCEGFDDLPNTDPEIRQKLNEEFDAKGITFLQERLKIADPAYYEEVDLNNPHRIIRALEVFETTGMPFSSFRKSTKAIRTFKVIKLGLNLERQALYQRINHRVDDMVKQGLVQEVQSLLPYRHLNTLNTVGYSELFDYFDGKLNLEEAIELIKQNTRRFSKRQLTWFRKDKEIQWFEAGNQNLVENIISMLNIERTSHIE